MKYVTHIPTRSSITIVFEDESGNHTPKTVQSSDADRFTAVKDAIGLGKTADLWPIVSSTAAISNQLAYGFYMENDKVIDPEKEPLPEVMQQKIRVLSKAGLSFDPILRFWTKLLKNPLHTSGDCHNVKQQLSAYIVRNDITIRDDGTFVLYKSVREDMTSHHDGVTKHTIGVPIIRELSHCNPDPDTACGRGLHAAPLAWVEKAYRSGIILEVALDPEHVISIPTGDGKVRGCWQLPLRMVGVDDKTATENIREGVVASTKVAEGSPEAVKEVGRKRKAQVRKSGVEVPAVTDRITIPAQVMLDAGFKPSEQVEAFVTDPRSRFVLVCRSVHAKKAKDAHKCVESRPVKMLPTGNLSLRATVLAMAKIWPSKSGYTVKIVGNNLIEVRQA